MGCFVRGGRNGMGCFVRGGKNGMGCFVQGDKNCMGCFVQGGISMRDVLSGVAKNGMGCFVRGGKKWHGMFCPGMFCPTFVKPLQTIVCKKLIIDINDRYLTSMVYTQILTCLIRVA